jgi:hypothetical protein
MFSLFDAIMYCYNELRIVRELKLEHILNIHKIIYQYRPLESGILRERQVQVATHMPPSHEQVLNNFKTYVSILGFKIFHNYSCLLVLKFIFFY